MRPLTDQEAKTVEANRWLVRYVLKRSGFPCDLWDDLESVGYFGLFRAVQVHMPERGKLSTIAIPYIRGYMLRELHRIKAQSTGYSALSWDDHKEQPVETSDLSRDLDKGHHLASIMRAIEGLKPIEKNVMRLQVVEDQPVQFVARQLHVGRQAVTHIRKRAIAKIRGRLKLEGVDFS